MNPDELQKNSKDQLSLVLSFFPRVASSFSFLLAIDTGMLGVLGADVPAPNQITRPMVIVAVGAAVLLATSILFIYRGVFPTLAGGHDSLVYFREIAKRTENKYIHDFSVQDEQAHASDILAQVWRNSAILSTKFDRLKIAFILTAVAVLPWTASLVLFAVRHGGVQFLTH